MSEAETPGLTADEVAHAVGILDRLEEAANRMYASKLAYLEALASKHDPSSETPAELWTADRLWPTVTATSEEHDRHLRIIRAAWRMIRQLGPERSARHRQTAGTTWGDPPPAVIVEKALTQQQQPWEDTLPEDPVLRDRMSRDYQLCLDARCVHCGTIDLRFLRYTRVHDGRPEYRGFLACSLCGLATEFSPPPAEPPAPAEVERDPATEVRHVAPAEPAIVKRPPRPQGSKRPGPKPIAEHAAAQPSPSTASVLRSPLFRFDKNAGEWSRSLTKDQRPVWVTGEDDYTPVFRLGGRINEGCWACAAPDATHSTAFHEKQVRAYAERYISRREGDNGEMLSIVLDDIVNAVEDPPAEDDWNPRQ